MMSDKAAKTFAKYRGDVALKYDGKRDDTDKRRRELAVLTEWLGEERAGAKILDCPVGTGWLFPLYRTRELDVIGLDASADMLRLAGDRRQPGDRILLAPGNAMALGDPAADVPIADESVDTAVCIRLLNLIGPTDMQQVLTELQRVARRRIIFNLRIWHAATTYRNPQRLADVVDVLMSDWAIVRNVEIHEPDFRMIMLEREVD
jgi:ubiquinone/menaquinone biosynthesis C-methylase UbiE